MNIKLRKIKSKNPGFHDYHGERLGEVVGDFKDKFGNDCTISATEERGLVLDKKSEHLNSNGIYLEEETVKELHDLLGYYLEYGKLPDVIEDTIKYVGKIEIYDVSNNTSRIETYNSWSEESKEYLKNFKNLLLTKAEGFDNRFYIAKRIWIEEYNVSYKSDIIIK